MQELNQDNFSRILDEDLAIVDFYANWCAPCRALKPILKELDAERDDLVIVAVDVEQSPKLAEKHNINALPTMLILRKGDVVSQIVGLVSKKQIIEALEKSHENST